MNEDKKRIAQAALSFKEQFKQVSYKPTSDFLALVYGLFGHWYENNELEAHELMSKLEWLKLSAMHVGRLEQGISSICANLDIFRDYLIYINNDLLTGKPEDIEKAQKTLLIMNDVLVTILNEYDPQEGED